MMKRIILSWALFAAGAGHSVEFLALKQADKIAISLTGLPLNDALKAKVIAGTITHEQLADELSKSPQFAESFAFFWTRLLGIQSAIDPHDMVSITTGQSVDRKMQGVSWAGLDGQRASNTNVKFLTDYINNHATQEPELRVKSCPEGPVLEWLGTDGIVASAKKAVSNKLGVDGLPILPGTEAKWQELLTLAEAAQVSCGGALVDVKPWWDPEKVTANGSYLNYTVYKTSQNLITRCGGAELKLCTLRNDSQSDRFTNQVSADISMEPGYLIGMTVAEDKPFTDVVTSPYTVMTGTYGYFMATWGKDLWGNYPQGSIEDAKNKIFVSPNVLDRKRYWIKRNNTNAGVLTTPTYQIITNGRRAKANRAYETFLCRKFVVAEGAKADPSDANPDLTQRTYCKFCHKSLEPMAAFFNRWPDTGVNNYQYDSKSEVNDTGRFNGSEGAGAAAFGKILAGSEGFADCSVKRAFEFVNGRKMNTIEVANDLPVYLEIFNAEKNLRSVLRKMVVAPEFLSPKGGE